MTGFKGKNRRRIIMPIIAAEITTAAMIILTTKRGSLRIDCVVAVGAGEAKMMAGVPHI